MATHNAITLAGSPAASRFASHRPRVDTINMSSVQHAAARSRRTNAENLEYAFSEKLRRLDQAAWSTLFDENRPRLWRYIYARTGNRDVADDIASQVFVEALESIHRYRYRGKPILAWLYRIARNQTGKAFRKAKREIGTISREPAEETADATLDSLVLAEALRALTSEQADVVALRFFAEYSTQEIAAVLGKSTAAIYSLEVRGIAALRRQLGRAL